MLDTCQCKTAIPKRWKTGKGCHLIALVFGLKQGSGPQHREAQHTWSTAVLLSLGLRSETREAERARMCRVEGQGERRNAEKAPENLHRSPIESRMELHEAGEKQLLWKDK